MIRSRGQHERAVGKFAASASARLRFAASARAVVLAALLWLLTLAPVYPADRDGLVGAASPGVEQGKPAPNVASVIAALEACRARLDPQIDIGFERIAARCPDLARRLERNALAAWLPEGWRDSGNNLSAGSLRELAISLRRELEPVAGERTPSVQRLHDLLAEIGQSARERSGFWKRVRLWLHQVFPSSAEPADTHWVARMIGRIGLPQTVIELMTYCALALVITLSVLILTNELREARLFRRRAPRSGSAAPLNVVTNPPHWNWQDVERAELTDKPRVLLELLLDRLTQSQRLPPARGLTTREIYRAAALPDPQDAERLCLVAQTAEKTRYGQTAVDREDIVRALESGRALLANLEQAR